MNKRKITRKSHLRIIGGMGIFILGGGLFLGHYFTQKEEVVSAHPTQEIILDPGGTNELAIPKDGTRLWETGLATTYDDYVQSKEKVANLKLVNSVPNQYAVNYSFLNSSKVLSSKKQLVLWVQRNEASGYSGEEPYLHRTGVALVDADFKVEKEIELSSGNPVSHNDYTVAGANHIDTLNPSDIIDNKDGTYSVLYFSIGNIQPSGYYNIRFDSTLNVISNSKINSLSSIEPYAGIATYKSIGNELILNKSYSKGLNSEEITNYYLEKINLDNNTKIPIATLKLPLWSDISSDSLHVSSFKTITDVEFTSDGGYFCSVAYGRNDGGGVPMFALVKFNAAGNVENVFKADQSSRAISLISSISSPDKIYFVTQNSDQTKVSVLENGVTVKEVISDYYLPGGTQIDFVENEDSVYGTKYEVYGNIISNSGAFSSLSEGGQFLGSMTDDFIMKNVNLIKNGKANFTSYQSFNNNVLFFSGISNDSNFSLEVPTRLYDYPSSGWISYHSKNTVYGTIGSIEKNNDFSPLIKVTDPIAIDISSPEIQSPTSTTLNNWNTLDRWLITGEKNGNLTSPSSIKVYDTISSNDSSYGQDWLEKRINRNYKDVSQEIDWKTLGFDKKTTGPQLVTYFVSDSQNQVSTTSRWINKKTPETIITGDYALEAKNFAVSLKDVSTAITDENDFKKLAKTNAWYMATSSAGSTPVVDEESVAGNFNGTKVKVDVAQLAAVQNAKEAKPYPVDVSYDTDGDGNFDGSEDITNRVWVFVTTKNTKVDQEADTVIYADDYEIPYRLASSETDKKLYKNAHVKVYQFKDSAHETDSALPTIADKDATTGLSSGANPTITTAPNPGVVQPTVSYHNATLNKTATTKIDVTLTSNVLVHLKQEIVSSKSGDLDQLPIPSEGYITLKNDDTFRNVQVPSGKEGESISYADPFYADFDYEGTKKITFEPTIPEFYSIKGYVVTTTNTAHHSSQIVASNPKVYSYDFDSGEDEVYVTVYLTPKLNKENQPQMYHWNDKENDLRTIKVD